MKPFKTKLSEIPFYGSSAISSIENKSLSIHGFYDAEQVVLAKENSRLSVIANPLSDSPVVYENADQAGRYQKFFKLEPLVNEGSRILVKDLMDGDRDIRIFEGEQYWILKPNKTQYAFSFNSELGQGIGDCRMCIVIESEVSRTGYVMPLRVGSINKDVQIPGVMRLYNSLGSHSRDPKLREKFDIPTIPQCTASWMTISEIAKSPDIWIECVNELYPFDFSAINEGKRIGYYEASCTIRESFINKTKAKANKYKTKFLRERCLRDLESELLHTPPVGDLSEVLAYRNMLLVSCLDRVQYLTKYNQTYTAHRLGFVVEGDELTLNHKLYLRGNQIIGIMVG